MPISVRIAAVCMQMGFLHPNRVRLKCSWKSKCMSEVGVSFVKNTGAGVPETSSRIEIRGLKPFTLKVGKVKTRVKGQVYETFRATVPKAIAEELGLEDGDYLFLLGKKAQWYHLLDLEEDGYVFRNVPEAVRAELTAIKAIELTSTVLVEGWPTTSPNSNFGMNGGGGNI